MKIFPQNLRDRQHAEIIRRRTWVAWGGGTTASVDAYMGADPPPPKLGNLGRLWKKGTGLSDEQAATGLPAASMSTQGLMWIFPGIIMPISCILGFALTKKGELPVAETWAAVAGLNAVTGYLSAVVFPRMGIRSLYDKPVSVSEVEGLLERTDDELGRAYLTLIRDAIRQEVPEALEANLREAIQALGTAIDRLPAILVTPLDIEAIHRDAGDLLAQAAQEPDRVIAESLERRADALLRRAEANDRSSLVARRSAALRAEITAQIEALREGLAAFHGGDAGEAADLSHLAESARRVAVEATSAAAAREELEHFVPAAASAAQETPIRAADKPAEQTVSLGAGGSGGPGR